MHAIQINLIYFEDYNEAELIGIVEKDTNQYGVYNLRQRIGLVGDTQPRILLEHPDNGASKLESETRLTCFLLILTLIKNETKKSALMWKIIKKKN